MFLRELFLTIEQEKQQHGKKSKEPYIKMQEKEQNDNLMNFI